MLEQVSSDLIIQGCDRVVSLDVVVFNEKGILYDLKFFEFSGP